MIIFPLLKIRQRVLIVSNLIFVIGFMNPFYFEYFKTSKYDFTIKSLLKVFINGIAKALMEPLNITLEVPTSLINFFMGSL